MCHSAAKLVFTKERLILEPKIDGRSGHCARPLRKAFGSTNLAFFLPSPFFFPFLFQNWVLKTQNKDTPGCTPPPPPPPIAEPAGALQTAAPHPLQALQVKDCLGELLGPPSITG